MELNNNESIKETVDTTTSPAKATATAEELSILAGFVYDSLKKGCEIPRADAIHCAKIVLKDAGYEHINACHVVLHMEQAYGITKKGNIYQL